MGTGLLQFRYSRYYVHYREAWTSHQQLCGLYRRLLLTDLEFALDRKVSKHELPEGTWNTFPYQVEQDLWNNCFKSQISNLQSAAKEKKSVKVPFNSSQVLSSTSKYKYKSCDKYKYTLTINYSVSGRGQYDPLLVLGNGIWFLYTAFGGGEQGKKKQ